MYVRAVLICTYARFEKCTCMYALRKCQMMCKDVYAANVRPVKSGDTYRFAV